MALSSPNKIIEFKIRVTALSLSAPISLSLAHRPQPRHLLTHRLRRGDDRVLYKLVIRTGLWPFAWSAQRAGGLYKLRQAGGRLPGLGAGRAVLDVHLAPWAGGPLSAPSKRGRAV